MAQNRNRRNRNDKKENGRDILGILLVIISAFLLVCIVVPVLFGVISRAIFNVMLGVFGILSYPLLIAILMAGICLMLRRYASPSVKTVVCSVFIGLGAVVILQLATTHKFLAYNFSDYIATVYDVKYSMGGVVFGTLAFGLKKAITEIGCYIVFSLVILVALAVMIDLIGIIRKLHGRERKKHTEEPDAQADVDGLTADTQAKGVVRAGTSGSLYVHTITPRVISAETGRSSDLSGATRRNVTDYSSSPVVERDEPEIERRRYALYGDAESVKRQETEEFIKQTNPKKSKKHEIEENAEAETAEPQSVRATVVPPATQNEEPAVAEPFERVSADAKISAAMRPKHIGRTDNRFWEVVFPVDKHTEFNDNDSIETAVTDRRVPPVPPVSAQQNRAPEFSSRVDPQRSVNPQYVYPDDSHYASPIMDAEFDVPPAVTGFAEPKNNVDLGRDDDILRSFGAARQSAQKSDEIIRAQEMQPYAAESGEVMQQDVAGDILDATVEENRIGTSGGMLGETVEMSPPHDAAFMIGDGEEITQIGTDSANPAFKRDIVQEPIRNAENEAEFAEPTIPAPRVDTFTDSDIINGASGSLVISEEPAQDLSESRDNTSDFIDGEDRSGMYTPVEEPIAAPKPVRQKKQPAVLPNQLTIEDAYQSQAESVVIQDVRKRKRYIDYSVPPIDLLRVAARNDEDMAELQSNAEKLEGVLGRFLKTDVKVINIVPGPTVTQYEIEVPSGVSVKQIAPVSEDIQYELATAGAIRIEAPIQGKRAVGVEIPNKNRSIVSLREIIESTKFRNAESAMTFSVGKNISGDPVLCDLEKIPHLLIAGQTGSGKSACLNGLIVSLLYKASPADMRFILVDPKRVEFSSYRGIPHLLFDNIISEPEDALSALKWACDEMERRYIVMAKYKCNKIAAYNALPEVASPNGKLDKMAHIIFIIDELADLMGSSVKREIEDRIKQLTAKARAAGIHLIVATQRPSTDVITGTIKTNLSSRIAFRVTSQIDSRVILDSIGAEALAGNGDMLFFPATAQSAMRVQGSFVSDTEVSSVVTYVKEHNETDFDDEAAGKIFKSASDGEGGSSGGPEIKTDELLPDVLALVIKSKQASASGIQRRFSIGYARAARIIDNMEEMGYIGPSTGSSKPREVRITAEQYRELFGREYDEN